MSKIKDPVLEPIKLPPDVKTKSPTEKTLHLLREKGYTCGIVERYIYQRRIKLDLFGIIDIIAIKELEILAVQSTGTDFNDHLKKLTTRRAAASAKWLLSGSGLMLIGWNKSTPRIRMIHPVDLVHALNTQMREDLIQKLQHHAMLGTLHLEYPF